MLEISEKEVLMSEMDVSEEVGEIGLDDRLISGSMDSTGVGIDREVVDAVADDRITMFAPLVLIICMACVNDRRCILPGGGTSRLLLDEDMDP